MKRVVLPTLLATMMIGAPVWSIQCGKTVATLGAGESLGVAVTGSTAVIGAGPRLASFDLTDPTDPRPIGEKTFGELAVPVAAFEGLILAFVFEEHSWRLAVIDPATSSGPLEIGSVGIPDDRRPRDLAIIDSHAWIATWATGDELIGVDLSTPEHPVLSSSFEIPLRASSITAVDHHLLVASSQGGLFIIDVADSAQPILVGSLSLPGSSVVAAGSEHAYVATTGSAPHPAVHVVDIGDPSAPVDVSAIYLDHYGWPQSMVVIGNRLIYGMVDMDPMIAPPDGGLVILDISDPSLPLTVGSSRFSSGPAWMTGLEAMVVVADAERGLRIIDTAGPAAPTEIARRNITRDDAFAVAVQGNTAYLGDQGLRLVDISLHEQPTEIGSVELDGEIAAVAVDQKGDLVLALAHNGLVSVVDDSDSITPALMSSFQTDGVDVAALGALIAIADGDGGLLLVDLADASNPVEVGRGTTHTPARSVDLVDDIALVGTAADGGSGGGLSIFDIRVPSHPVLLAHLPTGQTVASVDADSTQAALLTYNSLILADISDPEAPVEIGRYETGWAMGNDLSLDGTIVQVSSWPGNLKVVDFTEPDSPRQKAGLVWFPLPIVDGGPLGGYGVANHRGHAIVADGRFGLRIVELGICRPIPVPDRYHEVD